MDCPSTQIILLRNLKDENDNQARRQFVGRYSPLVLGFCRQRGLQDADPRDVAQNVFVAVARAMENFEYDPDRGRFRSWLGTITVREINRYLAWRQRLQLATGIDSGNCHPATDGGDGATAWETYYNGYLYSLALQRIRPSFDSHVWQAFEMTWNDDRKPAEVANLMQRKPQWVYSARFRVLSRLRAELEELAEDHPLLARS